jgi:hypothetical protein
MKNKDAEKVSRRFLLLSAIFGAAIVALQWKSLPYRLRKASSVAGSNSAGNRPAADSQAANAQAANSQASGNRVTLLTDPFLQNPTPSSVQVVWFTEFEGVEHFVRVEPSEDTQADPQPNDRAAQRFVAVTTQLSRTREDSDSRVQDRAFPVVTRRYIWRHEASVTGLTAGQRSRYQVTSRTADGQVLSSDHFTLAASPPKGQSLKILLTSDHQLMPMTPANLQKVEETVGLVDAVFFAGDLVNVPDRASEWFDDARGLAFFPPLQGRSQSVLQKGETTTPYKGGVLIQHAPLFPIIGNHEIMGRYNRTDKLKDQFNNTLPRELVSRFYPAADLATDLLTEAGVRDRSYNSQTYEEIFSLPETKLPDGRNTKQYYAVSFGDVRLVALSVTQIWRSPDLTPETKGRYRERTADLAKPEAWGYGQHLFEPIRAGSEQYQWLQQELVGDVFKQAKYKIVMLHHPLHTLGGNSVPAYTDPVMVENRAADGSLKSVQYDYPKENDYLIRDLLPLLSAAKVNLVFYGHSHLWNRFATPDGLHFLETSNVGNSYGAHTANNPRPVPTEAAAKAQGLLPFKGAYVAIGDPNGLTPIVPTLAPLKDEQGNALPYLASNDLTSFSIFETGSGAISSYYFDTREPNSAVVKFDEFKIAQQPAKQAEKKLL